MIVLSHFFRSNLYKDDDHDMDDQHAVGGQLAYMHPQDVLQEGDPGKERLSNKSQLQNQMRL